MEKLTDREVDIMMAVWYSANEAVPTGEILRYVNRAKQNSLQTIQVVLRRLCEKDVLQCAKGKHTNFHRALITKEDYLKFALGNFLLQHFQGSVEAYIRFLIKEKRISREDLDEVISRLEDIIKTKLHQTIYQNKIITVYN